MTPVVNTHQRILAVLLLALVLAGIHQLVEGVLVAKYQFYATQIQQLQDRLYKLNGMLATRPDLEARLRQLKQDESVQVYFLQQASPTLAATELQQRVKNAVESHGGTLTSTQILPVAEESGFTKVAIRVMLNGDTEGLQKILYDLEAQTPLLFIDNLQISSRQVRQFRQDRRAAPDMSVQLTTQFELIGYLPRSAG